MHLPPAAPTPRRNTAPAHTTTRIRRGVQTADRAVVRERQAIPGDQGRVRHRAIDPAALGPRHPRQRLRPGRGQPHARAERTGRAGEAQQAVGDGGGRFRTSGAGIRTKAGVIRANAARYPISAQCRIPDVPRSTYYWMTGHPGTERADCVSASWCPQYGRFFSSVGGWFPTETAPSEPAALFFLAIWSRGRARYGRSLPPNPVSLPWRTVRSINAAAMFLSPSTRPSRRTRCSWRG